MRSAAWPLVMNVFWPLSTYPLPLRLAVVRICCRSEPVPGSVIAMAPISSPRAMPGSQRTFCASVPYSATWCATMALLTATPLTVSGTIRSRSSSTAAFWAKVPPNPP